MSTDLAAVNPDTGEVLEHLDQQPPEELAEALDAVARRQAELERWSTALQGELRRRLRVRNRRTDTFGEWEVEATRRRESDWDVGGLEPVLAQLVEEGTVRAGDVADVITRNPIVSRSNARQLVGRLTGDSRALVEACCTWREIPGALRVTRSAQLLPAGAAEEALPAENTPPAPPTGSAANAGRAPSTAPRRAEPSLPTPDPSPPSPTILDPTELFAP